MQQARVLADNIGSPDQATRVYEHVLEMQPGHAAALEALARLREQAGDAHAALIAIEALANTAPTPEATAEQWVRAARLLEGRGDRDGAIERYKRALEATPTDAAIATSLRHAYAARGDAASVVELIESRARPRRGRHGQGAPPRRAGARPARQALRRRRGREAREEGDGARSDQRRRAARPRGHLRSKASATSRPRGTSSPSSAGRRRWRRKTRVRALVRFVEAYGRSAAALRVVARRSERRDSAAGDQRLAPASRDGPGGARADRARRRRRARRASAG